MKNVSPMQVSLTHALYGFALALIALLPFHLMGWMGAGDVKLAAALGIWLGNDLLIPTWAISTLMAISYGAFLKGPFWQKNYRTNQGVDSAKKNDKRFVPYGAMLCASTLIIMGKQML